MDTVTLLQVFYWTCWAVCLACSVCVLAIGYGASTGSQRSKDAAYGATLGACWIGSLFLIYHLSAVLAHAPKG